MVKLQIVQNFFFKYLRNLKMFINIKKLININRWSLLVSLLLLALLPFHTHNVYLFWLNSKKNNAVFHIISWFLLKSRIIENSDWSGGLGICIHRGYLQIVLSFMLHLNKILYSRIWWNPLLIKKKIICCFFSAIALCTMVREES